MSLRSKFLAWIISLITLIVIGIGAMTIFSESRLITEEENQHQTLTVQRLAKVCEESLYQSDVVIFNYFETLKAERGFLSAVFLDSAGKIQAQSSPAVLPKDPSRILRLEAPVTFTGSRVGTAQLLLSKDVLDAHIQESLRRTISRIGGILVVALFIGFLGALVLTKTMLTPIQEIVSGMKDVSNGYLDPIPLSKRQDELGWLGHEINATIGKLRELDEMKRNFFSRVTHDLRSPLIGIQGLVNLLLKGKFGSITTESHEALMDVGNFTTRLTSLIDDLLTSAKLESGREEVDIADFAVTEIIEEVSKFYLPLANEKGIPLILDFPKENLVAHADRDKIIHVLTNLVSNAYKFTKAGSVTVSAQNQAGKIQVSVADTGIGIPEAERSKIFDRFYRVEAAKKVKGTGLGLFIVKSLLDLQKGNIIVGANPGGGTKFTFTLPKS